MVDCMYDNERVCHVVEQNNIILDPRLPGTSAICRNCIAMLRVLQDGGGQ